MTTNDFEYQQKVLDHFQINEEKPWFEFEIILSHIAMDGLIHVFPSSLECHSNEGFMIHLVRLYDYIKSIYQ